MVVQYNSSFMSKMNRILYGIFVAINVFLLFGCEKQLLEKDPEATPFAVFDYLWEDVNNRYSFFEEKSIDWEATREKYRSLIDEHTSDKALFSILSEMLYELKDGHVNLTSSFDRSRNWDWFMEYPPNYNQNIIERYYLGKKYRITGTLNNIIIDSVLYVNYRSFSDKISNSNLRELMDYAENTKGVIIDVRSNGGGSLSNAYRLASCFTDTTVVFAKSRMKTGPGKNDFSEWDEMKIEPFNGKRFTGKVVVLINRKSYSATTFFSQMMKTLPNAVLMGDMTGGGGGIPAFGELPNGWRYRFSATQTINLYHEQIEPGVKEDVYVMMNFEDEHKGKDTVIESAKAFLLEAK